MTVMSRWNLSIFPCTCYVHYKWSVHINRTWTWKSTPVCYHNRTEEAKNSDARCRQHHQQSHHHSPHGKRRNWTISTVGWSKASIWLEPTAVKGSSVKPRADDKMSLHLLCCCSEFCPNDLILSLKRKWFDIDPNCTPSSDCLFKFFFLVSLMKTCICWEEIILISKLLCLKVFRSLCSVFPSCGFSLTPARRFAGHPPARWSDCSLQAV